MPRFVPATVTELTRVQLFAGLPGEKLNEIARKLQREEVPPGRQVVREGDPGERFYIVLQGLFTVSQEDLGPRRVLQPGGRLSAAVFASPQQNPWAALPMQILVEGGHVPPPAPGQPGILSLADPERLRDEAVERGRSRVALETKTAAQGSSRRQASLQPVRNP